MKALVGILLAGSASFAYSQAHVHGQGTAMVVQQEKQWQVQFTLPAADVFGFEHEPENAEQKKLVATQLKFVDDASNLFAIPGGCTVSSHNVESPFEFEHDEHKHHAHDEHDHDEHKHHDHDEHDHDEHKHHDHDEHNHDEHKHHDHDDHDHGDHESHSDLSVTTQLSCESAIEQIDFKLFSVFTGLQKLDVMWTTEAGQGASEGSPGNAKVTIR